MTSVTLTFDLWPWPFAWTSLLSLVITPENFVMIRWWKVENIVKKVWRTDRQTDRQTERTIHRAAWSQLKIRTKCFRESLAVIYVASYLATLWAWQWSCLAEYSTSMLELLLIPVSHLIYSGWQWKNRIYSLIASMYDSFTRHILFSQDVISDNISYIYRCTCIKQDCYHGMTKTTINLMKMRRVYHAYNYILGFSH